MMTISKAACKSRWGAGWWSRSGGQVPFNVKAGGLGPQRSGGSSNSQKKHGGVDARGAAAGCSSLRRLSPKLCLMTGMGVRVSCQIPFRVDQAAR